MRQASLLNVFLSLFLLCFDVRCKVYGQLQENPELYSIPVREAAELQESYSRKLSSAFEVPLSIFGIGNHPTDAPRPEVGSMRPTDLPRIDILSLKTDSLLKGTYELPGGTRAEVIALPCPSCFLHPCSTLFTSFGNLMFFVALSSF